MRIGLLCFLLLFCDMAKAAPACQAKPASGAATTATARTPHRASPERKAILGALRQFVKKMSDLDVIFVVRHLKVECDWAWIETEPQSADGRQHYEPVNALLARRSGTWQYVESPPEWAICEDDPDCADASRYFQKLALRHPGLSPAIFPVD